MEAKNDPNEGLSESSSRVLKISERYNPELLESKVLYVFAKIASMKFINRMLKVVTIATIKSYPKSYIPSSSTSKNLSLSKFPSDALITVRADEKMSLNSGIS